ncbi:hypothetical protein C1645_778504 [Glomus cerebriforme]|uniref:Uncharacterized protein n=1 Tax=Glomus cerebriforme TaxID=658196 RepID=A0A397SPP6_9GLOM|nr:hypothetical protein C1645_778504 [Glomus cerebriforme]
MKKKHIFYRLLNPVKVPCYFCCALIMRIIGQISNINSPLVTLLIIKLLEISVYCQIPFIYYN